MSLPLKAQKTQPVGVIGYIRVSTEDQLGSNSFEQQSKEIEKWCERRGVALWAIYFDAVSGSKLDERPGLLEAVDHCKRNDNVGGLTFFHFNRFFRDVGYSEQVRKDLSFYGKQIWSTQQEVDLDNHFGVFNFQIQQAVAELQRKEMCDLLYSRRMAKGQAGGWVGHGIPYGKKVQQGELINDSIEQRNIRLIRRLRNWVTVKEWVPTGTPQRQMTLEQIAAYMNLKMQFYCPLPYGDSEAIDYDPETGIAMHPDYGPKHMQPKLRKRGRPYLRNRSGCWTHHSIRGILVKHGSYVPTKTRRSRKRDGAASNAGKTQADITPPDIGMVAGGRTA